VTFFTACIVRAYEALHSKGFVYRDMKPANVLLKDNGYCVLIDFGLAAKMDTALKGKCGTRGYWSPEMVKGDQYLASGDWWSLGVTLVELLTGKKPFKKKFQKYLHTRQPARAAMTPHPTRAHACAAGPRRTSRPCTSFCPRPSPPTEHELVCLLLAR
jgi:serine/threonine protein kinase